MVELEKLFKTGEPARDKFLSRLFGIFNEEAVRCWAACEKAPYENLGRPTVSEREEERGSTLDFSLRSRLDGKVFVAEMKCELEYENYKYLRLTSPTQLLHHSKPAFNLFLKAATNPKDVAVRINGRPISITGSILVWGAVADNARQAVQERFKFHRILSLEEILEDLLNWRDERWLSFVSSRRDWAIALFDALAPY